MPSPFPGMNPYLEQDDVWHDFRLCFTWLRRRAQSEPSAWLLRADFVNEFFFDSSDEEETDCPQPAPS